MAMLKLCYSATSPFVRKVLVSAIETGQDGEIERIPTVPTDPASGIAASNPLNKVPALILEDGTTLIDSAVICEFLDHRKGGKLFPPAGPARWAALQRQALADGIMDAAILRRYELQRPENLRSADWDQRQKLKMDQGLDALERAATGFGAVFDIGTLTVAIMLDYLDFRYAHEAWREKRPALATWHKAFSARPSLQATLPRD
jgi:glutathione S-transferase